MAFVQQTIAPRVSNSGLAKRQPFSQIISSESYKKMLESAIQDPKRRQRFVTTIISAVNSTPKLKECDPNSIITAALQMEALGLAPGLGDAYLIPYGKENPVAQFQMGARGYVQLAMRSGQYLDIDTIEVREGEYKGRDKSCGKAVFEFIEDDDVRESLPIVGYLAYFTLLNGFHAQEYFSHAKMLAWADRYSQSFDGELYRKYLTYLETGEGLTDKELRACSSPWYSSFTSMAEKTVLKRLLSKKGVLSIEMIDAFKNDMKDGTTDGLFEMNLTGDESKQNDVVESEVVEAEAVKEEPQVTVLETKEETKAPVKRGRPAKTVTAEPVAMDIGDDLDF